MYADYVLKNVAYIYLLVVGVIGVLTILLRKIDYAWFSEELLGAEGVDLLKLTGLPYMAFFILLFAVVIVVSIIGLVLNVVGYRRVHHFVKSVYQSLDSGDLNFAYGNTARIWLMVFGILSAVGAVRTLVNGSELAAVNTAITAAVEILGSVLIKKYFAQFS